LGKTSPCPAPSARAKRASTIERASNTNIDPFILALGKIKVYQAIAGMAKISEVGELRSWSWLFIIEGPVALTVVPRAWFGLPETRAKAKWWTAEELEVVES
jgi:hypothetical protein